MTDEKNKVFELLGAYGDDIEALTAYGLYKRHKRAWAKEFESREGKPPSQADDQSFAKVASTDDQLERYRKDARDILIAFANQTVTEAKPDIEKEAITARIEVAASQAGAQTSFKSQLGMGLLTSAATTVIWIVLAIGVRVSGIDPVNYIQALTPSDAPPAIASE